MKARVGWHQGPWSRNGVILKGIHWTTLKKGKKKKEAKERDKITQMEEPGVEPGASYMRSTRSTTELHPLPDSLSVRVLQEIAHYILWASSQLVFVVLVVVCVAAGFTTSLRQRKSGNCEGY